MPIQNARARDEQLVMTAVLGSAEARRVVDPAKEQEVQLSCKRLRPVTVTL
jgi:hypothetical protein